MSRARTAAVVIATAAVVAGCGSSGGRNVALKNSDIAGATKAAGSVHTHNRVSTDSKHAQSQPAVEASKTGPVMATAAPTVVAPTPSVSTSPAPDGPPPTGPETPVHKGVPVAAALSAKCLRPGDVQRIAITTQPKSGVVYDAVYADGKYGGTSGYYGGNAGGQTDAHGRWSSHWVVAASAPAGPTRVDVGAATPEGTGYTTVWFHVAGPGGTCE